MPNLRQVKLIGCYAVFLTVISLGLFGCASSSTRMTESRTTVTEYNQEEGNKGNFISGESSQETRENGSTQKVVEKTEVKEEKATRGSSRGVLGTTLHFVGQVLAFPFKIIAGVIEFIF